MIFPSNTKRTQSISQLEEFGGYIHISKFHISMLFYEIGNE
jgi:hypothetical protein